MEVKLKEVTADTYKPVFRHDVETSMPNGQKTPVNPVYCLVRPSTEQLAKILADLNPEVFMSTPYPMKPGGGGVSVNFEVGWLRFPSGLEVNAGTEANWWVNASSGASAEANCRKDLQAAEQQYAIEGGGQQSQD
jgi:hypothetical protein